MDCVSALAFISKYHDNFVSNQRSILNLSPPYLYFANSPCWLVPFLSSRPSMFSFRPKANNHAIAAARASSPTPKDPKSPIKPARPKASPRKSSSGETPPSSPTPIARSQTSYFSKQQTPLRAAETVYYDAQSNPPTAPPGTVIITFSKPGVLPPLYVTTSMTDWELHEMAYTVIPSHGKEQVVFHKDFLDAQPGQHMYRFRVGRKTWIVDDACEVG